MSSSIFGFGVIPRKPHCVILSICLVALVVEQQVRSQELDSDHLRRDSLELRRCKESERVTLGSNWFFVKTNVKNKLQLHEMQSDGVSKGSKKTNITFFSVPEEAIVIQIKAVRWWKSNLCILIKTKLNDEFQYYCLNMLADASGRFNGSRGFVAKILTTSNDLQILSANAEFEGDGLIVLFGSLRTKDARRVVEYGTIFMHDCPQPAAGGALSHFTSKIEMKSLNKLLKQSH